jgi:MYXO-CTERM domain-containing protein
MSRSLALPALTLAFVLAAPVAALADVPPPNSTECNNKNPGDACMDDLARPGTCVASQCPRYNPQDGGVSQNPCTLCIAVAGGASTGSGTGTTTKTSSGGSPGGGGGCAMAGAPPGGPWWPALAFALPLLRRRRGADRSAR